MRKEFSGMKNNKLIVVLGMHRSGTSAVTRALTTMGVELGDSLMPPNTDVNAKGFWEDVDLNALNIEMLNVIESDWQYLTIIEPTDVEILRKQGYVDRAVNLLKQKVSSVKIFGFKDPRVAKLLPFWNEVFSHCQLDVSFVITMRHPLSVAMSLAKRDGLKAEQSYFLWFGHVLTSIFGSVGSKRVLVDYDRLMKMPDRELNRIANGIGLKINLADLELYKNEFLDVELQHTLFNLNDLLLDETCPPIVKEVYSSLLDVATDKIMLDDLKKKEVLWLEELKHFQSPFLLIDKLFLQTKIATQTLAKRDHMLIAQKSQLSSLVPLVSIIIVNYNGFRFLKQLLSSLAVLNYPRYEIIFVDNASKDESVSFVENEYPNVKIIKSKINLGFAEGNNIGIEEAQGELIALINNDTVVDSDWLLHLVNAINEDINIGAVGSKILFFKPYIEFTIKTETFTPAKISTDIRELGVYFDETSSVNDCSYNKPIFVDGFFDSEYLSGQTMRWTSGIARVMLPFDTGLNEYILNFTASAGNVPGRRFSVLVGGKLIYEGILEDELKQYNFLIPMEIIENKSFFVINNAGTFLDAKGNAKDRGIYQPDRGQYNNNEDIDAFCGAAVLFRKSVLTQVGGFDKNFFMYYEDADLSWRMKKKGYKINYEPKSIVKHIHTGSSKEWSPLFMFFVMRNSILMRFKNATLYESIKKLVTLEIRLLLEIINGLKLLITRKLTKQHIEMITLLFKIQLSLLKNIPISLLKRFGLISDTLFHRKKID